MSFQVLARKWRPYKFQDVIGQDHITRSLQNAVQTGKIGHAYIFSGTRGVGKTSLARIFAKSLRCENKDKEGNPCNKCPSCADFSTSSSLNIIEIDGASNNSVENVRDLIANAQYLPTSGAYKVYIIDEVHMLSASAFNALLKTLEEPPAHVVFILATTAPEKLLETVLSRCQRFDFRHVSLQILESLIKKIAQTEKIHFENDQYIRLLCMQGKGSVRDTLSLLDQILVFSKDNVITEETLSMAMGLARISAVRDLALGVLEGHPVKASESYRQLISENVPVRNILSALLDYLFEIIEAKIGINGASKDLPLLVVKLGNDELIWIYETLVRDTQWVLTALDPEKTAEVVLQKLALRNTFLCGTQSPTISTAGAQSNPVKATPITPSKAPPEAVKVPVIQPEKVQVTTVPTNELKGEKTWDSFLKYLGGKSPALTSNLEQGNLVSPIVEEQGKTIINLGLGPAEKVFWEYLLDPDINKKLINHLTEFFTGRPDSVVLKLTLLDEAQKAALNFMSLAEIRKNVDREKNKERQQGIMDNPIIRQAAELFHSKVDKVILNEDK